MDLTQLLITVAIALLAILVCRAIVHRGLRAFGEKYAETFISQQGEIIELHERIEELEELLKLYRRSEKLHNTNALRDVLSGAIDAIDAARRNAAAPDDQPEERQPEAA
ncbi:hypothetical protein [Chromobacterium sp. ASV23]|uniref:hypothetical protein n=1 Tax=Chromobacterium sp. ASV23 TaxID=2795110 RepID=UPI0018EA5211|nr:hypothetical protein [Chromobacterium sp. ASV23]